MRLFNILTIEDIMTHTKISNIKDMDKVELNSYSRNYNIPANEFLPCITPNSHTICYKESLDQEKQDEFSKTFEQDQELGKDLHSYSFCNIEYVPPVQTSKEKFEELKQDLSSDEDNVLQICNLKWGILITDTLTTHVDFSEIVENSFLQKFIENRCFVITQGVFVWNLENEPFTVKKDVPEGENSIMFIPAIYDDIGRVLLLTTTNFKNFLGELEFENLGKNENPLVVPLILDKNDIETWIYPSKQTEELFEDIYSKSLENQKDYLLYKSPKIVNNLTQKSEKNLMTLDEYEGFMKQNGGINNFYSYKKKGKKFGLKQVKEMEGKDYDNWNIFGTKKRLKTE